MNDCLIRSMTVEDISKVHEVELSSFSLPWPIEAFEREILLNEFAHYYVVELKDKIIGYGGMWIVHDQVQVTNVAILPEYRGKQYGSMLLGFLIGEAKKYGGAVLSLEVRVSNTAAMSLYKKFGLQPGGIRKRYYTDNGEDALVMWVNL